MSTITYFARTNTRSPHTRQVFGIKRADRLSHMFVVGKTGVGKSTLLRTLILQDLERGEGLSLFDPHGDLVESVVGAVPEERQGDMLYLNVPDTSVTWHFNPLAGVPEGRRALATANMVEVFKKLWSEDWGPRLEHVLRNVVWTLLENPGSSLGDIPRLLADKDFRRPLVSRVANEEVRDFWREEYTGYSDKFRAVVVAPLQNKVGAFLTDPLVRRIVTGERSTFDLRQIIDEKQILLVNLSKGQLGEGPASLLGSLLVSSLSLAALGRAGEREEDRRHHFLYLDEFHTFATLSLATMLSELRKYRLGLVLAHQYLGQLEPDIRDAVFGNAGTFISFRLGGADAPTVAREFEPVFSSEDLVGLPNYNIYLRLMIDGQVSKPFSAETLSGTGKLPIQ